MSRIQLLWKLAQTNTETKSLNHAHLLKHFTFSAIVTHKTTIFGVNIPYHGDSFMGMHTIPNQLFWLTVQLAKSPSERVPGRRKSH